MTAFNRLGCTHVGASKGLMNGILRGEWGFKGYVITDSVKSAKYFLPSECLVAGNDRMLGGSNNVSVWGYTEDEVADDLVIQAGVRESYHRYLYTYVNSSVMNGISRKQMQQEQSHGGSWHCSWQWESALYCLSYSW